MTSTSSSKRRRATGSRVASTTMAASRWLASDIFGAGSAARASMKASAPGSPRVMAISADASRSRGHAGVVVQEVAVLDGREVAAETRRDLLRQGCDAGRAVSGRLLRRVVLDE